jgi:tetratricopeptide (TPR) repeat protein
VEPPSPLRALLERTPADGLVAPLTRFEGERAGGREAGEAAFVLGQFHYARGEYRGAADAFSRAAAQLEPGGKPEARYWAGLSWLGVPDLDQARAQLEEVERGGGPRRPDALLALALAWDKAGRPERARELLERALAGDPGESGAAILARLAAIQDRLARATEAQRLRDRLTRQYPRSIEAAGAATAPRVPVSAAAGQGQAIQIGAFVDRGRAERLAEAARRAGFVEVRVAGHGSGGAALYTVLVGRYATEGEATREGERAARTLGVAWHRVPRP